MLIDLFVHGHWFVINQRNSSEKRFKKIIQLFLACHDSSFCKNLQIFRAINIHIGALDLE